MDNSCDFTGAVAARVHRTCRRWTHSLAAGDSSDNFDHQPGIGTQRTSGISANRDALSVSGSDLEARPTWHDFSRSPSGNTSGPQQATLLQQWRGVASWP